MDLRGGESQRSVVDGATARKLASDASVHPETIRKMLRGEHVRGLAGHRARAVLTAAGLLPVAPITRQSAATTTTEGES
jgi:hypothetical protein